MINLLKSDSLNDNNMNSHDSLHFKNKLLENLNLSDGKEDIVTISLEDLPEDVKIKFEAYSANFIYPEDYREGNFEKVGYIQHDFPSSYITYFATQDKQYDTGSVEKMIYLFEKNDEGIKIGHAEIRLCIHNNDEKIFQNFFKDKPFVGYTLTEDEFLKSGYGLFRLIHMNRLVKQEFGLTLFSSDTIHTKARRLWQELVKYQLAIETIDSNGKSRFSFV